MIILPSRTHVGASFQGSKWQKFALLLNVEEMAALFAFLDKVWIIQISGVIPYDEVIVGSDLFLKKYAEYLVHLREASSPLDPSSLRYFSSILTSDLEAVYTVNIKEEKCLVKVQRPVIQMQAHRFDYTAADQTFRSMVFGYDSIQWGIQFSYPAIYQDEKFNVFSLKEGEAYPNYTLFKRLQEWVRYHTSPTCFEVDGKRTHVPIRLGKKCREWIHLHPQLLQKNIKVIL